MWQSPAASLGIACAEHFTTDAASGDTSRAPLPCPPRLSLLITAGRTQRPPIAPHPPASIIPGFNAVRAAASFKCSVSHLYS